MRRRRCRVEFEVANSIAGKRGSDALPTAISGSQGFALVGIAHQLLVQLEGQHACVVNQYEAVVAMSR